MRFSQWASHCNEKGALQARLSTSVTTQMELGSKYSKFICWPCPVSTEGRDVHELSLIKTAHHRIANLDKTPSENVRAILHISLWLIISLYYEQYIWTSAGLMQANMYGGSISQTLSKWTHAGDRDGIGLLLYYHLQITSISRPVGRTGVFAAAAFNSPSRNWSSSTGNTTCWPPSALHISKLEFFFCRAVEN